MNIVAQMETLAPAVGLNIPKPANLPPATLQSFAKQLAGGISWFLGKVKVQSARKTLRLCENLALGDKRFVAVIQVENERFLIGGAAGSISLLTRLEQTPNFSDSLQNKLKEEAAR
jgi:flagellar biogenesis protein FliO